MSVRTFGLALIIGALAMACGGKVVVDAPQGSGGSGVGGSAAQGGGWGTSCLDPPPTSSLTFCGSSSGSGSPCVEYSYCQDSGHTWTASCDSGTCQCKLDSAVICTCALSSAGDMCGGTPHCCPWGTPSGF
jgi:hypothetical protein